MSSLSLDRLDAGRLCAVVTVVVAVPLQAMSLSSKSQAWELSLGIAALWGLGGTVVCCLVPRRFSGNMGTLRALGFSCMVGAALATAAFVGGVVLWHIPWLSSLVAEPVAAAQQERAWLLVPAALLAGLAEETFFRLGLPRLLKGWWRWLIPIGTYAGVTASTGSVGLAVMALMLGVVAMWAVEVSGRWFVPLVVHGIWTLSMIGLFPVVVG